MTTRWIVAALHLLALGIGLGAVWARARAFQGSLDTAGLRRSFAADTWWGIAAAIWIATGLARAFGGLEKGAVSAYLGAVPVFANRDLAKAAASILGDEAMHWAILRNALGEAPVPSAFVS